MEDIYPVNKTEGKPIPGPSVAEYGWAYFKNGCDFLRLARAMTKKYGDIVHAQVRIQHHFYINQPDLIEKILLAGDRVRASRPRPMRHTLGLGLITSDGDLHGLMRRFMQPFFQRQNVASQVPMIVEQAENISNTWRSGEQRDIFKDMTNLALRSIIQVLFGTAIHDEQVIHKIERAAGVVHHYGHQSVASHINMEIERMPVIGPWTSAARSRKYIEEIIYEQIRKRRSEPNTESNDLLAVLLKLQQTPEGKKYLTDKQIRDELMTLFFAGHETTASGLSWTFYLLSQHPDVEQKLHAELDQVLQGRLPTINDLPNLNYTRMILSESMRLYPPVWTLGRRPLRGHDLWIDGYRFPNKSMILISPYLIHHDERFYPDPERFDPNRFTPEEEAKRPKSVYFPFGGGNRKCIGESLAWLESFMTLSVIASRWKLRLVPGHRIGMEPLISLKPKYGMRMILEKRSTQEVFSEKQQKSDACCPHQKI